MIIHIDCCSYKTYLTPSLCSPSCLSVNLTITGLKSLDLFGGCLLYTLISWLGWTPNGQLLSSNVWLAPMGPPVGAFFEWVICMLWRLNLVHLHNAVSLSQPYLSTELRSYYFSVLKIVIMLTKIIIFFLRGGLIWLNPSNSAWNTIPGESQ